MKNIEDWGNEVFFLPDDAAKSSAGEGMWWPEGHWVVPNTRLKQLLARSARWHARQVVDTFISDDVDKMLQAAISCGCAVELISKAKIADVAPSLLADRGHTDSVYALTGNGDLAQGYEALRTIGAAEAVRMVAHVAGDVTLACKDALDVRNSAAHMALVQADVLRTAVIRMCRYVERVLPLLDLGRDGFWGGASRLSVIDELLDEAKSQSAHTVAAKKAAAQARLDTLTESVPLKQLSAMAAALDFPRVIDFVGQENCPVCKCPGWSVGTVQRGELEWEYYDDEAPRPFVSETAFINKFDCPVCKLHLSGQDEVDAAGLLSVWELDPDDDPSERYDYEPDEDDYRDR